MSKPIIDLKNYIELGNIEENNIPDINVKKFTKIYEKKDSLKRSVNWYFLQYNKEQLTPNNYSTIGLVRSVLTDGEKIHVYSPSKSVPIDFVTTTPYKNYILEELVEGTMINLFWNSYSESWDITTKGGIGGYYRFYQDIETTFRDMFIDAMIKQDLEFDTFDKTICYSFVLQHPDNRIVIQFKKSCLILVGMYKIDGMKVTILDKYQCNIPNIKVPKTLEEYAGYQGSSWEDLQDYFNQMNLDYRITGVNIYNKDTGLRSKLRNPTYEYVRRLKGNSPKIQFQYYSLRQVGRVGEFLKYYREYKDTFTKLRNDLHDWTNQLWKNYIGCYVKKEKPLKEFPKKFRTHMFNLHQIYLNDLRELGHYISKQIVIKYVNSIEPAKLMYTMNYDLHQCRVEENIPISSETSS